MPLGFFHTFFPDLFFLFFRKRRLAGEMEATTTRFDGLFEEIAGRTGGIEPLLDSFFGFLSRRTDFYVEFDTSSNVEGGRVFKCGFPRGKATKILLDAFKRYPFKSYKDFIGPSSKDSKSNENIEVASTSKGVITSIAETEKVLPANTGSESNKVKLSYTQEGKQIPIGNGGVCESYWWTQTVRDATIYVSVDFGTKSKDVSFSLQPRRVSVSVKGVMLLSGELDNVVSIEDSLWTLATDSSRQSSQLIINFEKSVHSWWRAVIKGHPEIDTSKVVGT